MLQSDGCNHKEGIVYKNQFHIVFCPKYRRKVLVRGVDTRLKELLNEIAQENDIMLKEVEVLPDHVRLLIETDTRMPVHAAVRALKGKTSRVLREEFPWLKAKIPSLWTRSYFCCTVGHIGEEEIQEYIISQKNK